MSRVVVADPFKLLFLIGLVLFIEGCSLGGSSPSASPPPEDKVILLNQNIIEYNSSFAFLKLVGKLEVPGVTELSAVAFHLKVRPQTSLLQKAYIVILNQQGLLLKRQALRVLRFMLKQQLLSRVCG